MGILNHFNTVHIGGVTVFSAAVTTRAAIVTIDGGKLDLGSICISTSTGEVWIKVAHTEQDTDWNLISVTSSD
jgi:hypothetical protein